MKVRVKLTPAAESDLLEIWSYVFSQAASVHRADAMIAALHESFSVLAEYPSLGVDRPDFGPGVRAFVKHDYVVLYWRIEAGIEVLRVGSRDADLFTG